MHEAKTRLSQLVQRAERGEKIVITRNGTPVVELTPVPGGNRMADVYGIYKGRPSLIADDFDRLSDEVAEAFGIPESER